MTYDYSHYMETLRGNKRCAACGETKPLTEFYKRKDRSGKYREVCKPCHNANKPAAVERPADYVPFSWLTKAANEMARYSHRRREIELRYPGKMYGSKTKNPY